MTHGKSLIRPFGVLTGGIVAMVLVGCGGSDQSSPDSSPLDGLSPDSVPSDRPATDGGSFDSLADASSSDHSSDAGPSVQTLTATCTSLMGKTIAGVAVTSTKRIEASANVNPAGICQVMGSRAPLLQIEVDIPDNWSGRLLHQGGGGFDGFIISAITPAMNGSVAAVNPAITQKGAIYAASNGGNNQAVPAQAAPAIWASGTPDGAASAQDYAYRALGTTIGFAKALAQTFYGASPRYTYFNGCSEGGREAYQVIQRWPGDYDGVVQGCETMSMSSVDAGWLSVSSKAGTPAAPSAAQYAAAYAPVLAACDGDDGVVDGYMAAPTLCKFDPATLVCGQPNANPDPALCLSSAQLTTLQLMLSDLTLTGGSVVYSKLAWSDFSRFAPGYGGLGGGFALLATGDPSWLTPAKQATFNLNSDYYLISQGLFNNGVDHDKAAIATFVASGKKLISWHDAGDNLLSAADHGRHHAEMTTIASGLGLADPRSNTRLYLVPASSHGAGGGFAEVDWLSAIVDWVETNTPPAQLTYAFSVGTTKRTLPVCEYPRYPKYNGSGDQTVAASFTCTAP
jgi:hypothetical protein